MIVSVGQLYSSARLLELVAGSQLTATSIREAGGQILVAPMSDVLNLCTRCGWLEINSDGSLRNSSRGESLRIQSDYQERLRQQLRDIVTNLQPSWSKKLPHGRREFSRFAPADIVQCFKEAGLLTELNDLVIEWWSELSQVARGLRSAALSVVGRRAEKLTLTYESIRTGREAYWQSMESSFSGYDVLSIVSSSNQTPMQIEVKASELRIREAELHLTSNEWEAACNARAAQFHLWHLGQKPQLAVVMVGDLQKHIPGNYGEGLWESVRIPFRAFTETFQYISI